MSDEMKNNGQNEAKVETVADKLNSAAQTLMDANAEAKIRKEEEKKQQALLEKEEKARREEEEKRRTEDEKKREAMLAKKQAQLDNAENYRKKLAEERARSQALAAKRRAAKKRAEEERRAAEELERKNKEAAELEEAKRRNAESDSLVDMMSSKARENEKAAKEREAKLREAREKAAREAEDARKRLGEKNGPIIITADGMELFPGSEGYDEALANGARPKDEVDADANSDGPTLASEDALRALQEKMKALEDAKNNPQADEPVAEEKPELSDPEDADKAPEEPEDYVLTLDTSDILGDDEPMEDGEPVEDGEPAEDTESDAGDPDNTPAPEAEEKPEVAPAPEKPDPVSAYLFGSTYAMMKKTADFGEEHEEKKRQTENNLAKYRETDDLDASPDPVMEDGGFNRYDAGEVLHPDDYAKPKKVKKAKTDKNDGAAAIDTDASVADTADENKDSNAAAGVAVAAAATAGALAVSAAKSNADKADDKGEPEAAPTPEAEPASDASPAPEAEPTPEAEPASDASPAPEAAPTPEAEPASDASPAPEADPASDAANAASAPAVELAEDEDPNGKKNKKNKKNKAAEAAAVAGAAALGASAVSDAAPTEPTADERLAELRERREAIEAKLRGEEDKNREEIAALEEKERAAKLAALEADSRVKEERYKKEIDELNKKLEDTEREHAERKKSIEDSISSHESREKDIVDGKNREDFDEKRAKEEADAANAINGAAVATLTTKKLKKFLNKQDTAERKLQNSISNSRKKYKKSLGDPEKATANLGKVIEDERKLLGSYVISYKHADAAKKKKYSRIYSRKLTSLTKDYNEDLKTWQALTDTEVNQLPDTFVADVKAGNDITAIPVVYYPDEPGVRTVETPLVADDAKAEKRAIKLAAASVTASAGVAAMTSKDLKKFLAKQDEKERKLVAAIDYARKKEKSANVYEPTLYINDYINNESELLNSYVLDYQTIVASNGSKKTKKQYSDKIKSLTKTYNSDLGVWRSLTDSPVAFAPTTLVDDMDGKRAVPVFESICAPDASFSESRREFPVDNTTAKERYSEGVKSEDENYNVQNMSKKDIAKYLNKRDSEERKLINAANKARKKYKKADGAARKTEMKKCLNSEAALINSYMDTYRVTVLSGIGKYQRSYSKKLNKAIKQYKEDAAVWTLLTDTVPDMPVENLVKSIAALEDYKYISVTDYNDLQPVPEKENPKVLKKEENVEKEKIADRDGLSVISMSKNDLRKYLNKQDTAERKLIKTANTARKKHKKKVGNERLAEMKKCLDSEVNLINGYMDTYRITVLSGIGKYHRNYSRKLKTALKKYGNDADTWTRLTDMSADIPPKTLVSDIKNGSEYKYLGYVYLKDLEEKKADIDPKKAKSAEIAEQKRFLKEENEREKRLASRIPAAIVAGREILIEKKHMQADIRTLEDKIDYRRDRYSRHIELSHYRYGENSKKNKKLLIEENAKLKAMQRGKRKVINARKKDNKRYLELVQLDATAIKTKNKADSERLVELQERIENMLLERDEINMRLNSLYAEENVNGKKRVKRNYRSNLAKVRLAEVKRAFRGQASNYRTISKFRVPLQSKQRVYDSMNKRIELLGYLTELKYRLKYEKSKGAARRAIKEEISNTKRRLQHTKTDISKGIIKLGRRSARTPNPKIQFAWLLVLFALVILIALAIVFKSQILGFASAIIGKLFPAK